MPLIETDLHPFLQILVSLSLGLLVGLQREWVEAPLAGIRTFALIAVFGTMSAILSESYGGWFVVAGLLVTAATTISGRFAGNEHEDQNAAGQKHTGLTTDFAVLLMFVIGVLVRTGPLLLPCVLAGLLAALLQAKGWLHALVLRFDQIEIKAIMQFALISLVILPVVPDRSFGPYEVLNPRNIWMMVSLMVGISLAGYILYKFLGARAGVILSGVLGGVISSTATTLNYARRAVDDDRITQQCALIILLSWTVLYVRLWLELAVAAPGFRAPWIPLGILFLVSVTTALFHWRKSLRSSEEMPAQKNPTELKTALGFGMLYSLILIAVAFAKDRFGNSGLTAVAIISGITDVDAISLSTAKLAIAGNLSHDEAWPVVITAVVSNIFFKGVMAGAIGGWRLFRALSFSWLATMATGIALLVVRRSFSG